MFPCEEFQLKKGAFLFEPNSGIKAKLIPNPFGNSLAIKGVKNIHHIVLFFENFNKFFKNENLLKFLVNSFCNSFFKCVVK